METKQPLLSICIPTYNRANVLKDCIKSLVQANGFSDEVEIIISDNCSTDETQQVAELFAKDFPNIKYFRNDANIGFSRNLLHVLELGTGAFLKISNDYNIFRRNSLSFLLETIKKHAQDKPVLYFSNQTDSRQPYSTSSFDKFILNEKMGPGWISNYGYWKEDFDSFTNRNAYTSSWFPQLDWLILSYLKKRMVVCYNSPLFVKNNVKVNTATYNCVEDHAINYLMPLNTLYDANEISSSTFEEVKKQCLYCCSWMIIRSIFLKQIYFKASTNNGWKILKEQFGDYVWYKKTVLKGVCFAIIAMPYEIISSAIKRLSFFHHQ